MLTLRVEDTQLADRLVILGTLVDPVEADDDEIVVIISAVADNPLALQRRPSWHRQRVMLGALVSEESVQLSADEQAATWLFLRGETIDLVAPVALNAGDAADTRRWTVRRRSSATHPAGAVLLASRDGERVNRTWGRTLVEIE